MTEIEIKNRTWLDREVSDPFQIVERVKADRSDFWVLELESGQRSESVERVPVQTWNDCALEAQLAEVLQLDSSGVGPDVYVNAAAVELDDSQVATCKERIEI